MSTEFQFPYGQSVLTARLPEQNIAMVLRTRHTEGLRDEAAALTAALRAPVGCASLVDCLEPGNRVVVITTDNTRACPDDRILPPLLAELESKVPRENITIMVALGLHAALSKADLARKLGEDIVANYCVFNHDSAHTVNIGTTSRGCPVEINRTVLEADFRVSTGFIEPHFFAGFSGGSKSITPGVASQRAIWKNHSYGMIGHPLARAGILAGNPIHEDVVEQAKMARLNFIVNVLLNENKEITHVVAGDPVLAHEKGCRIEKRLAGVKVDRRVDIAITTNSGAPLDLDLYQTVKGIDNASLVTRDGGIIIVASACNTGVGPQVFREVHTCVRTPREVLQKIRREEPIGVQWQNQVLARAQLRNDVYLVSSLPADIARDLMMVPFATIEAALEQALRVMGSDAEIAVIPEGPLVLPLLHS